MRYQFATERPDYSDLASGRVLYSLPGHPAFPIRLADEILQRCMAIQAANRVTRPYVLYDPFCGAAYHLSVLVCLHWRSLRKVIGSDIDPNAVTAAKRNLGLLTIEGLDRRIGEISQMLRLYGKESHRVALESANRLRNRMISLAQTHPIETCVFQANALDSQALSKHLMDIRPDIVFVDVPYGLHSTWQTLGLSGEPVSSLWRMLEALLGVLSPTSILAVASDKRQKASHEGYQRMENFQVGKRRVVLMKRSG